MKFSHFIAVLTAAVIFCSCRTTAPYPISAPMTREVFLSRDGKLAGFVPDGWFTASQDDTLAPAIPVWLTRNDLSANIVIRELILDNNARGVTASEGLRTLARTASAFAGNGRMTPSGSQSDFAIRDLKCCSEELVSAEGNRTRLVVFETRGHYYSCEASGEGGRWTEDDYRRLFTVQQTLLSTLQY